MVIYDVGYILPQIASITKGTRIPKVIDIWIKPAKAPFISVGAVSLIYFPQKTPYAPPANPKINLPALNSISYYGKKPITEPRITNILVNTIQFHLPYLTKGLLNNAPAATPPVKSVYIVAISLAI